MEMKVIDERRFKEAISELNLGTESGHNLFIEYVHERAFEFDYLPANVVQNLGRKTLFDFINGKRKKPIGKVPYYFAFLIYTKCAIDITEDRSISLLHSLDFEFNLSLDAIAQNIEADDLDVYDLKNFNFQTQLAHAVVVLKDDNGRDFEKDILVGFDQARVTISAEGLKVTSNLVCAEGANSSSDYKGSFKMRLVNRDPLNWMFTGMETGKLLEDGVRADGLCKIETNKNADLTAEITVKRNAMKLRLIDHADPAEEHSQAEQHRNKFYSNLMRRAIVGTVDEYLVYSKPIVQAVS